MDASFLWVCGGAVGVEARGGAIVVAGMAEVGLLVGVPPVLTSRWSCFIVAVGNGMNGDGIS